MSTQDSAGTAGYVDLYLLPVPEKDLELYRQQAATFGQVVREHGGRAYREFRSEDVGSMIEVRDGEVLTTAVAEFDSREHRDEVMARVMEDPRVKQLLEGEAIADMSKMHYGGFEALVSV
jgi:uncharacterized protein YbaA (DUF1428 family)